MLFMADIKKICMIIVGITIACILLLLYLYNSRPSLFQSFIKSEETLPTTATTSTNDPSILIKKRRFPKAIIIGVRKGGTKALISMLDAHPLIVAAKGEIHYFDRDNNYSYGLKWYLNRMPLTNDSEIGIEKSPSYFVIPKVPKRIRQASKDVKLILIVRNPVQRTISDYTQLDLKKARKQRTRPSIEQSMFKPDGTFKLSKGLIKVSLYDVHFQRWLRYFKPKELLVVNGDQLITEPFNVLIQVEKFLKVPSYFTKDMFYFNQTKGFYCWRRTVNEKSSGDMRCLGSSKGLKHPHVANETISKMTQLFRPHMKKFCDLAKVSFTWCKL